MLSGLTVWNLVKEKMEQVNGSEIEYKETVGISNIVTNLSCIMDCTEVTKD
jgi:hypothetical protein